MKLPNGANADLGTKLEEYTLNPHHWDGRHKARVFESVLGITMANAEILRDAILTAVASSELTVTKGNNGHDDVYLLKFDMATERGRATIQTAWIIRHEEDFPRLVTCYIL